MKLVYERARGRSPRPVPTYRSGVHMWHPIEDVRAFAAYRRRGELDTRSWLRSLAHRQHFSLLRWDDPQPSLASNAQRVRRAMRKMTPVRVRS